jgi:hypothetical protein
MSGEPKKKRSRVPTGKKRGRPRIELTEKQLDELKTLAGMHCTNEEIAQFFGMSTDTLTANFAEPLALGKARGKISLRRSLWGSANKGSVRAQIWLSKQHLGMSEKVVQTVDLPPDPDVHYHVEWGAGPVEKPGADDDDE